MDTRTGSYNLVLLTMYKEIVDSSGGTIVSRARLVHQPLNGLRSDGGKYLKRKYFGSHVSRHELGSYFD